MCMYEVYVARKKGVSGAEGECVYLCNMCAYVCLCGMVYVGYVCVCGLYVCEMCGMLLWYVYDVHVGYVHGYDVCV